MVFKSNDDDYADPTTDLLAVDEKPAILDPIPARPGQGGGLLP